MVVYDDLTLESALADPLIALVRRADGVNRQAFAALLQSAALRTAAAAHKPRAIVAKHQAAGAMAMAARKTCCGSAHAW